MAKSKKAMYIFPRTGKYSVVAMPYPGYERESFPMLEFEIGREDKPAFESIVSLLRRSRNVVLTHAPNVLQKDSPSNSNIILSFHESKQVKDIYIDPLLVLVQLVDMHKDKIKLVEFNSKIFSDGFVGVSITLEQRAMFLFLLEVVAVAPPIREAEFAFEGLLSVLVSETQFFAEYLQPLQDPMHGLSLAVHHFKSFVTPIHQEGVVNLTGLIPEGKA